MSSQPPPSSEKPVGYQKPPSKHQFRKGQSGNPKGRPKPVKVERPVKLHPLECALSAAVRKILGANVTIREGEERADMTVIDVGLIRLAQQVVAGDPQSIKLALKLYAASEKERMAREDAHIIEMLRQKREGEEKLALARARGLPEPEVIPHPDDIIFDERGGEIHLVGPLTPEEKDDHDFRIRGRDDVEQSLQEIADF